MIDRSMIDFLLPESCRRLVVSGDVVGIFATSLYNLVVVVSRLFHLSDTTLSFFARDLSSVFSSVVPSTFSD
jgi:hypothetical protein